MRPLRGGQGTFDRLIENIRSVAGRTSIAIGGTSTKARRTALPVSSTF
jgi:hypothetical protein